MSGKLERRIDKRFSDLEVVEFGKRSHLVRKGSEADAAAGDGFDFAKVKSVKDVPDEILLSLDDEGMQAGFKELEKTVRRALLARWIHLRSGGS